MPIPSVHSLERIRLRRLRRHIPLNTVVRSNPPLAARQKRALHLEIRRFLRANGSTLLATALEWGLISALVHARVSYLIAAGIGAAFGAVLDFWIKRHWAFLRRGVRSLQAESVRYLVVSALSLGWNLLIAFTLVHWMHLPAIPGVITASVIVGILWNYPMHRLYVFRELHMRLAHDRAGAVASSATDGVDGLAVEGFR